MKTLHALSVVRIASVTARWCGCRYLAAVRPAQSPSPKVMHPRRTLRILCCAGPKPTVSTTSSPGESHLVTTLSNMECGSSSGSHRLASQHNSPGSSGIRPREHDGGGLRVIRGRLTKAGTRQVTRCLPFRHLVSPSSEQRVSLRIHEQRRKARSPVQFSRRGDHQ